MKISAKKRAAVYEAIHRTLVDLRITLQLRANEDSRIAESEHIMWRRLCEALDIESLAP